MEAYLDAFAGYLRTQKSATASTLQSYCRDIRQFLSYMEQTFRRSPLQTTPAQLEEYLAYLRQQGRSSATLSRFAASVRCYYQFLVEQGSVPENPAAALHVQREQRCLPEILTNEEVDLLFAQPARDSFKGLRDKAMLELLYATGIRVSELVALNEADLNIEAGMLCCRHEEKQRMIPIYHEAVAALADYLAEMRGQASHAEIGGALFVNLGGHRLSRQGFWKIIKGYAAQAGICKCITPHTLRHSFAAHLLENGADLKSIQIMLGHADISSTQFYEQFSGNSCRSVYNRCHPKA